MSQYNHNGYGQWPGNQGYQQPPQMPGQYMYQQHGYPPQDPSQMAQHQNFSYPNYPPPGFPPGDHHASSHAAFNHNATQVPGLGISGPPPANPAQQYGGGWGGYGAGATAFESQQPQQAPPEDTPYDPVKAYEQAAASAAATKATTAFAAATAPAPKPISKPAPKPTPAAPIDVYDDGEVSDEGLFDDLYDPDPVPAARAPPNQPATAAPQVESEENNEGDATDIDLQDDAFYNEDDDEPGEVSSNANGAKTANKTKDGGPSGRQRSASYSPCLSTREIHDKETLSQQGDVTDEVSKLQAAAVFANPYSGSHAGLKLSSQTAGSSTSKAGMNSKPATKDMTSALPQGTQTNGSNSAIPAPDSSHNNKTMPSPPAGPMTLDVAQKEAQKAILRLVPYGVKYQTYIDEGFDEQVIKALFTELGLGAQIPASSNEAAPASKEPDVPTATTPQEPATMASKTAKETPAERSARIKQRLAAVKSAKPAPATTTTPAGTAAATSTATGTAPPATANAPATSTAPNQPQSAAQEVTAKPISKKEALLKQKLEQLQKARQQRDAQSAARKKEVAENQAVAAPTTVPQPEAPSQAVAPGPTAVPSAIGPPPFQSISSSPIAPTRKRPTASDFFEYAGPTKRVATEQNNQVASAPVLEVTDESDDDDVEMELDDREESPEIEQVTTFLNGIARNGPAIRDFPPLTDNRPYASATSSVPPTPPNGLRSGGNASTEDEYSKKMRQIEEMRQRIADIEAKKAKKTLLGAQTPTGATGSPLRQSSTDEVDKSPQRANSDFESMRLPKPSDAGSRQERRLRIASVQLPKLDAHLREKMAKLKIFQDKIASLQKEILQGEAEKQQLTKEMEELDKEPEEPEKPEQPVVASPMETTPQLPTAPETADPDTQISEDAQKVVPQPEEPQETQEEVDDGEVVETTTPEVEQPEPATAQDKSAVPAPAEPVTDATSSGIAEEQKDDDSAAMAQIEAEAQAGQDKAEAEVAIEAIEEVAADIVEGKDDEQKTTDDDAATAMDIDPVEAAPEPEPQQEREQEQEQVSAEATAVEEQVPEAGPMEAETAQSPQQQLNEPTVTLSDTDMQDSSAESAPAIAQISDVPAESADMEIVDGEDGEAASSAPAAQLAQPSFTSYDSPLQIFRSYRFHPDYNTTVKGGLKSLTYSNKIDLKKTFCPHELAGDKCPDGPSCAHQHFSSLAPKDDQILVELGRSDDFTGETKSRFVAGLREVLQNVRSKKLRDFNSIAAEIVNYRRRFLDDNSKILTNLNGVNI